MRTDDLIAELAARARRPGVGVAQLMALAIAVSIAGAFLVMLPVWGLRPDLHEAMRTGPFWMKAGYALAFAAAGAVLVERLGRPGGRGRVGWAILGLALASIALLAAIDLATTPMAGWHAEVMGHSARICAISIALISAPAFLTGLLLLRRLAPTRPALAGVAAGLLAGGIGASVYGLFCQETGAAFTAIWYTSGMLIWPALGGLIGARLLRW